MPSTDDGIAKERCDRCGARAKVRAVFANGVLHFCAHHFNQHEAALVSKALTVMAPGREPAAT